MEQFHHTHITPSIPDSISDSIPQKPKRGRPKKIISEDTPIIQNTLITNDTTIKDTTHVTKRRTKKCTSDDTSSMISKKKGRPRLNMTDEQKLLRHREITSKWQKENRELSSKFSSEFSKKGRDALKILKDLVKKKLIPDSHSQTVNELFTYKKISI